MSIPNPPQPSWLLIICSILVIAGCVLFISGCLSSVYQTHAFFKISGIFLALFPAALGIQQYRGTFRYQMGGANFTAGFLYFFGGLSFIGYVVNVGEAVLETNWRSTFFLAFWLLELLAFAVCAIFIARLNKSWAQSLKRYYIETATQPVRNRFTLRELLGTMTILAVIAGLSVTFHRNELPSQAEHVSADNAPMHLPDNSSDISYCKGFRGTIACEFTTDEKSFVNWVEAGIGSLEAQVAGVSLQPITEPVGILRYYDLSSNLDGPENTRFENGLEYYWSKEDRRVKAIYDRDTSRAYYYAAYH